MSVSIPVIHMKEILQMKMIFGVTLSIILSGITMPTVILPLLNSSALLKVVVTW